MHDVRLDGPKLEAEILELWRKERVFERIIEDGAERPKYVFYEGPPTANGRPGIHHVLARTFKDLYPRYKTMRGFHCPRKAGWDTHGLPVEHEVEKELGIFDKKRIEAEVGIQEFVEAIQPALWTGLFEELDQLEAQIAEGLESQTNRIAEMEHRLMAAIGANADRNAVSQDALLALARRVAADVSDPAQALKELEKAVEIAVSIQNSADAEHGSLAEAAALAARGQHDAASHAIDAAIAQAEQGHRQLIARFLSAGIEQAGDRN